VAAIPIYDACHTFPGSRLIVVNATGRDAFDAGAACSYREIRVPAVVGVEPESIMAGRSGFDVAVGLGRTAVLAAFRQVPVHPLEAGSRVTAGPGDRFHFGVSDVRVRDQRGSLVIEELYGDDWLAMLEVAPGGDISLATTTTGQLEVSVASDQGTLYCLTFWEAGELFVDLAWTSRSDEPPPWRD
jgi:hypothetical protein